MPKKPQPSISSRLSGCACWCGHWETWHTMREQVRSQKNSACRVSQQCSHFNHFVISDNQQSTTPPSLHNAWRNLDCCEGKQAANIGDHCFPGELCQHGQAAEMHSIQCRFPSSDSSPRLISKRVVESSLTLKLGAASCQELISQTTSQGRRPRLKSMCPLRNGDNLCWGLSPQRKD